MTGMSDFDYLRQQTADGEKIEKTVNLEGAIQMGTEAHGAAFQRRYTAKKKGLKMKIDQ